MKNKLVVFEGIDGVGKTTLSKLLRDKLANQGIKAVRYEDVEEKNNGFNLIKPFIKTRVSINSSLLFYLASALYKSQQIEKLLKNSWVICDRYIYSTLAYHRVRNADLFLLSDIKRFPIKLPDFLFLIKVNDDIRLQRIKTRSINNAYDFKTKMNRNFVGKMEKEFEKFDPIVIDNSHSTPLETIEKIFTMAKRPSSLRTDL